MKRMLLYSFSGVLLLQLVLVYAGAIQASNRRERIHELTKHFDHSGSMWISGRHSLCSFLIVNKRMLGIVELGGSHLFPAYLNPYFNPLDNVTEEYPPASLGIALGEIPSVSEPITSGGALFTESSGWPFRCAYWTFAIDNGVPPITGRHFGFVVRESTSTDFGDEIVFPSRVRIFALCANLLLTLAPVLGTIIGYRSFKSKLRLNRGLCPQCGYPRGKDILTCSECGKPFVSNSHACAKPDEASSAST